MLDNLSQPVAFATIPLTASVESTGEGNSLKEDTNAPIDGSKGEQPTENAKDSAQVALEAQLAMALDEDDEEFLSGVLLFVSLG